MTDYVLSAWERPDMFSAHFAAPSSSDGEATANVAITEIPVPRAHVAMREIEQ
jgi:hypothetical protein